MFERERRDRHAGESLRLKILRWRLILFFPLLLVGMVLSVAWPSIAPLFRARSGPCTRIFSTEELSRLADAPVGSLEVNRVSDRCEARLGTVVEVDVLPSDPDDSIFADAVWELSYKRKSDFARLPGAARAFVAVDEDGRGRLIRLLDGHAFVDLRVGGPAGLEAARKAAALLTDGRLARFDSGVTAYPPAGPARPNTCQALLPEADLSRLWDPPREVDLVRDWRSSDLTLCSRDFLVRGQADPVTMFVHRGPDERYAAEVEKAREEGSSIKPLPGAHQLAIVRAPGYGEVVFGVPGGVGSVAVKDPGLTDQAFLAFAKALDDRRKALPRTGP